MTIDRQELQLYSRIEVPRFQIKKGWNIRYTTDLTGEVSYYLRGEEYSLQMHDFFSNINNHAMSGISTFDTALQTDRVINQILNDSQQEPGRAILGDSHPGSKRGLLFGLLGSRR